MSTTPRSLSPVKAPSQNGIAPDQSMMVELPTHLGDETEIIEPHEEDVTVRLHSQTQSQPQSPPLAQGLKIEQSQEISLLRNLAMQRQRRTQTPDPQNRRSNRSEMQSPGHLAAFDWEDFEDRYEKALQEADEQEKQLLEEFDNLVKYFNVWASASSTHDNERAVKRLQTRERHVRLSEQTLLQKKQHLSEVVKAFQSALALLSTT
ncbi:uncharacterized protein GGS22DRAFT_47783 [Annulohypoxylon maeteangense]|uniref:uncharacterized protein n=1 Tax=Annulohypoxylon maeteangense TaxID=1927788 RepID=UPI00200838DF|nr:uncharacterized protein GGS22DRAFT_47783 [Annulohypoxylon maeteangense]KAI0882101.1 hypothetical protein GGS22DRAFT_47783 [Annulohypoxylon maeteangense]